MQDPVINDLLNKEHSLASLEQYFNVHQKEMSLLQHAFLLYRTNKIQKYIK